MPNTIIKPQDLNPKQVQRISTVKFNSLCRIYLSAKHIIIASDNGLSPDQRQTTIRTNVAILSITHPGTDFSEFLFNVRKFPFMEMHLKMLSAKWRPFWLGLNALSMSVHHYHTIDVRNFLSSYCNFLIASQSEEQVIGWIYSKIHMYLYKYI